MFEDHLRYDRLIDNAMRNVVKEVLIKVSKEGLQAHHHFLLSFLTTYPGASIPPRLISRYPEEMTIVLQHQYESLDVHDDHFSVMLSFDGIKETIVIPYESLSSFADPGVKFGLKFNLISNYEEGLESEGSPEVDQSKGAEADAVVDSSEGGDSDSDESANNNVVSLNFSKDKK